MTDLVIRDARLVDGSGAPARPADVVVDGGRIVEVTNAGAASTGAADQVLDADGRLVTPGWVDVHTHYDAQVTWDPWVTPSSWHGVTTVVMGNCGVGFAPAEDDRHEWLIELMEGVEDIPGSAMTEGITWEWTSFPEYLDAVERQPKVLDVGAQIAHGPLRAFVMGQRGADNEPATAEDSARMADLVEDALRAGALGFSTSRTPLHRSKDGELVPGTDAAPDELLAIGDALARAGHGVFQFAPDHARVPIHEWPWMADLARRSGRTVSVNLNQPDQDPEVWRQVLRQLEHAHANGLDIVAQVAGRSIGILVLPPRERAPAAVPPRLRRGRRPPDAGAPGGPRRAGAPPAARPRRSRRRRLLPARGARQGGSDVAGRRARHRLRARGRHLDRGRGRRSRRAGHGGARRPAHRRGRQRDGLRAVLQLQLRRPVDDLRGHAAPAHPDGAVRRRRPLRRHLRRRHAHVHAHPLGPRPPTGPEAAARARRAPPDAPDRRAVRAPRPGAGGARACAPT